MSHKRLGDDGLLSCHVPRSELKKIFQIFDVEFRGHIDARELKASLAALGVIVSAEELRDLLRGAGQSVSDPIYFDLFCTIMEQKMPRRNPADLCKQLFLLFGGGELGYITLQHLEQVCDELKEDISLEELHRMIAEADLDGDGRVTFDDFSRLLKLTNDLLEDGVT